MLSVQDEEIWNNSAVSDSLNGAILKLNIRVSILKAHDCAHGITLRQACNNTANPVVIPGPITLKFRELCFAGIYFIKKLAQICIQ